MRKTLLFFLLLSAFFNVDAQILCKGKMINARQGKTDSVCFLRNPNPIDNHTKYTILLDGVEIYEVEFTYYREGDSIGVLFFDKLNTIVKKEIVKLKPEDSHVLICDYEPNIWPIKDSTSNIPYRIEFSIDDDRQFITLYQFQAIGGIQTQFLLQNVSKTVWDKHFDAVMDYRRITHMRDEHDSLIARFKADMLSYRDKVKRGIEEKENANRLKTATLTASSDMQAELTKKYDSICLGYFKSFYHFTNDVFDVTLTLSCDGFGSIKIDTGKTLFFKTGEQRNWFRDSFLLRVKPQLEKLFNKTLMSTFANPNLKADFSTWFEKNLPDYGGRLGEVDSPFFADIKKQIMEELGSYETRTVNIPTLYTYSFNYTSIVKNPTWKLVTEAEGKVKITDKTGKDERVEITDSLKQIFRNKFEALGDGKFNLKVCSLSLNNGAFTGQDIQLVEKK